MSDENGVFVSAREVERIASISRWVIMRLALAGAIRFRLTKNGDPRFSAEDVLRAAADPIRHRKRRYQLKEQRQRRGQAA